MVEVRRSPILRTVPFLIAVCFVALPAHAKYSGGTGEPNDPYKIATAADLIALGETPADYDKHFLLTADIDLDPNLPGRRVFDRAVIAPDTYQKSADFEGTPFTGVFDGDGHTISNLTITGGSYLGLLGCLGRGEVKRLGILDVNIVGSGNNVGGLVGRNHESESTVTQCYSMGAVSGDSYVGGLVGLNCGTVTHCHSASSVSGDWAVGRAGGAQSRAVAAGGYCDAVLQHRCGQRQ